MKIKLKNLLLAAATVTTLNSLAADMPSFWQDTREPWSAKYFYAPLNTTTPPDDWYTHDFDDSAWDTIEGAIYMDNSNGGNKWEASYSAYWLRSHFNLDDTENLIGATLKIFHNDGCSVYLNGNKVYDLNSSIYEPNECYLSSSLFDKGHNVLAVYVADTNGWDAYIDFGLQPYQNDQTLNIDVQTPGTMGDSILACTDNFSDVVSLKVSGKLNDKDMETIATRLTNLRILDMAKTDITAIADRRFIDNKTISKVMLPENLDIIGAYAFCGCSALTEIVFPEGLREIQPWAFQYTSLKEVNIPEGVVSLGEGAFYNCEQNKYVSFPSTLKTIPNRAFYQNYNLANIFFSEGLETIESDAFSINNSNALTQLTELVFPSSLRSISAYAFGYHKKLQNIKFNEGLKEIGNNAFCCVDSLRSVTLPSTLVRADASPFDYCENLKTVTCLSIEPPYLTEQITYGCDMEGRELYVPSMSLNIYKQTTGWDKFPSIKPIDHNPDNIIITRDETLTLPENWPAGYKPNLTLQCASNNTYGRLELNGNVNASLNRLSMVMNPTGYDYWGGAFYNDNPYTALINNVQMSTDSVEATLYTMSNRWIFISFPFDVKVSDIRSCLDGTTSFVIRRYSGANRAAGESVSTWVDMTADDILKAGEGYILQAVRYIETRHQDYAGLIFTSMESENLNNVLLTTDASTTLEKHSAEQEHNRGWNLIGNPYPCYYDSRFLSLGVPVTVWDGSTYRVYSPLDDSYVFTPGEAFFIQCPTDEVAMAFDKAGRQKTREVREIAAPARILSHDIGRKVINLSLTGVSGTDATRIVLNDKASLSYESTCDAAKFFSPEGEVPQLFTFAGEVEFAINERPVSDGLIALGMRIGASGSYTIALEGNYEGYQVWLDDMLAGESVRLDTSAGYTFTTQNGKTHDRFRIRFVSSDINAVDQIETNTTETGDFGTYTIDGRRISNPEAGSLLIKNGKKVIVK